MFEQTTPSLEKLKEFIGRETILQDVHAWLQDGGFHSVYFSGDYGIGKTRLLQRILDLAHREWKCGGVPTRLVDLYHFRHHSPEGLARAIAACFENTDDAGYFEFYLRIEK
jgi:predicted ATPase